MNFSEIVKSIESLPPLSDTAVLIQELYIDGAENVNIIQLVRIIEKDALLVANILKMINAPIYGFSKKIASISQAVSLFGTFTIYGLVVSYAMHEQIKADTSAYNITSEDFNDVCHMQSNLIMQWYSKIDLRHAQFLTPIALIMETGKLVVAKELEKNSLVSEFRDGLKKSENLTQYEDSFLGTSSYFITGLLFEHWNIEPLYVTMLKNLDYADEDVGTKMERYIDTLDVVRTAVNIKSVFTKESIKQASQIVSDLDLDAEYFESIAHRVKSFYLKKGE